MARLKKRIIIPLQFTYRIFNLYWACYDSVVYIDGSIRSVIRAIQLSYGLVGDVLPGAYQ